MRERNIHLVRPSTFPGVYLTSQPSYPFAWILRNVRPSAYPAGPGDPDLPILYRYDRVNIYGAEVVDGILWYLIDSNQWIGSGMWGWSTLTHGRPEWGRATNGSRWTCMSRPCRLRG